MAVLGEMEDARRGDGRALDPPMATIRVRWSTSGGIPAGMK